VAVAVVLLDRPADADRAAVFVEVADLGGLEPADAGARSCASAPVDFLTVPRLYFAATNAATSSFTSSTVTSSTRRFLSVGAILKMRLNAERCMFWVPSTTSMRDERQRSAASKSVGVVTATVTRHPRGRRS
jgi:hypothetical protein